MGSSPSSRERTELHRISAVHPSGADPRDGWRETIDDGEVLVNCGFPMEKREKSLDEAAKQEGVYESATLASGMGSSPSINGFTHVKVG